MDSSNSKASGIERRSSTRRSSRLSEGPFADDEDDYDLTAATVSDGFRPTGVPVPTSIPSPPRQTNGINFNSSTALLRRPPPVADISSKDFLSLGNRPSSTSKPPRPHDSLTLRNDGSSSTHPAQQASSRLRHPATNGTGIQLERPLQGHTQPSHPYDMYPQRTLSNATSSTAAVNPRPSLDGPRGPTHPYALYSQNTVPVEDASAGQIPVGFNGIGNTYQRRLGPDGEEAGGLIGPSGHLEELPPYTRYPEQSYARKQSIDNSPNGYNVPVPTIPGAGGIGVATRNPEFSSADDDIGISSTDDDLGMRRSRPSIRSVASTISHHEINTAARDVTEKPPVTKWQRRAKKKMCGIVPYWAICLLVTGLILMGIIMGAVIGTLLSPHKPKRHRVQDQQPPATLPNVEPLKALPPNLPPLTTGPFGLPRLDASQLPQMCFNDSSQAFAWSCNIPFTFYMMNVTHIPGASDLRAYNLSLVPRRFTGSKSVYGTQLPAIPQPMGLMLVNDTFEQDRGPAWWLSFKHKKSVLVRDGFPLPSKRHWLVDDALAPGFESMQLDKKRRIAQDGDRPWNCTWPETTMDIFIYPNQTASLASIPPPSLSQTQTPTASSDSAADTDQPSATPVPLYPKLVRFVERHLHVNPRSVATCRQVIICNDGQDQKPVMDEHGQPRMFTIAEKPNSSGPVEAPERNSGSWSKRDTGELLTARTPGFSEFNSCGCLWWAT